eukprot:TRINITY_DN5478_c0_g1::TRINITY_DN5478_c0_g1_i1::g.26664::m.26664 TRINITY_DN5478_c0_g1::TRINITY_DN5478_c0_g1_i1::g.26664  ORF type:complete len:453 (-),score=108.39,sp/Q964D8/BUP1_DICDI/62.11/4e-176,CN_hydrolase/PF00795.17/3.3e+03,CN_hydrolase/PF00795.17/8.9e-35,AP_endonuc_2/PF01261.19/2.7,AP_endonuc_2/PF01261.19/1.1e+02 TRINITY_DN5478_c0_g1_i1:200-1534(-)
MATLGFVGIPSTTAQVSSAAVCNTNRAPRTNVMSAAQAKPQAAAPTLGEVESLEKILEEHLPPQALKDAQKILFGNVPDTLPINDTAKQLAEKHNFEIKAFKFNAPTEQRRKPRTTRIAVAQNTVVLPTTAPVDQQYKAIQDKIEKIIDAAAAMGVNVLCLQEAWTCPFFFCTRENYPWLEFSEPVSVDSPSGKFISAKAKQHNMVIVSPILERDLEHGDTIHNTAVVFSNTGAIIGKHRKNHIPRTGDFNESTYYLEGDTGHPVFETAFGNIAINICYGRHHPLNWLMFGLNGAEVVFNPAATVGGLSEPLWPIEARCGAVANNYFAFGCNRVGTESFPNEYTSGDGKPAHKAFGHFYGSSYATAPDGSRTPGLSRVRDGILISEVDLNMCRQVKDKWKFQLTGRYAMYADALTKYSRHDYQPLRIRDPSLPIPSQQASTESK